MESKVDTTENLFDQLMKKDFLTSKEYFDETQQGPFGFYNGSVDFVEDFSTYASSPYKVPGFAARVANQLFCAREKQLANGSLSQDDAFNVMECGGGNGNLAFHVLGYIEKMAKKDKKWKSLWDKIHYHLVECSPALVKEQKERNITNMKSGKVTVTEGNALNLDAVLPDTKIAVALSNELVDMLQPYMITLGQDGGIKVKQVLPTISKAHLGKVIASLPTTNEDKAALLVELEKQSNAYKEELRRNGKTECKTMLGDAMVLSRNSYLILNRWCLKNKKDSPFKIQEVAFTPADSIPDLHALLKRHPQFVAQIKAENQPGKTYLANANYTQYLQGVKNKLLPNGGEIITIDYGANNLMLNHASTTTYKNGEIGKDMYATDKDVTSDVDWTKLVQEGEELGLHKTYFNKQCAMRADMFPKDVLSAKDNRVYEEKDQFGTFKILVQSNEEKPDLSQWATRFSKPSEPVSYEELAGVPPLYTIGAGKIKINLSQIDIDYIDTQIAVYNEQAKMARAKLNKELVIMNMAMMEGDPATVVQVSSMLVALWKKVKTGVLIAENEKDVLKLAGPLPERIKQYPTIEQAADLRQKRSSSELTMPSITGSNHFFATRVTLEYKDKARDYVRRLHDKTGEALGEDIVTIDPSKKQVSFQSWWLHTLKDKDLTEIATELEIEERTLKA